MARRVRFDRIWVLIRREYGSRVKTKGFWLGTLLLPIFMAAMAFLPSLFLLKSRGALQLVIVDESGRVGQAFAERIRTAPSSEAEEKGDGATEATRGRRPLATRVEAALEPPAADTKAQAAELDRRVLGKEIDAWLRIPADVLAANVVEYHGESVSNFVTQELLEGRLSAVVREVRLSGAGLDVAQIERLSEDVDLQTTRVTEQGGRRESGMAGFFVAYFLFFLLFITIMIWGQQVLTGVLEEKASRIVEVIVSAVSPFEFLMGKLLGIAAVGLTQLGIWLGFMVFITAPAVVAAVPMMSASGVQIPVIAPGLLIHFLAFFLLGFLLYASYFAAIGSAFNNLQEAQQTAGFLNFFLVAPFICFMAIINDPDSALSVGLSFFPLFTPLLMMLRIAVKMPPAWQVALGYLISIGTVVGMVWVCSKIYRVGILMYGKKPTLQEIWKWLRYA